jgi:hypothetical protein
MSCLSPYTRYPPVAVAHPADGWER